MLWVGPAGARTWVQRLSVGSKRRDLGLGGFPTVTLAEAREMALENKRIARRGGDPLAEKRRAKSEAANRLTFAEAAQRTCEELAPTWKSSKEPKAFLSSLRTYAFPTIGSEYVTDVTSGQIRQVVLACRKRVPNQSVKVQHRIFSVFRWAVAEGIREANPAAGEALALPKLARKTKHFRALPYSEVAAAIETVKDSGAWVSTKLAIEFVILTAGRSIEVRGALWSEIDMKEAVWAITPERMKMGRPHRVPLSNRAIEVLCEAELQRDGSGLVFPSLSGRELSDMTLSKLVRELGIPGTVHGFRTSFRTWAQECTNFPREVAEAALSHKVGDSTEQAYARSDVFEKRRKMMGSWASFVRSNNDGSNAGIG